MGLVLVIPTGEEVTYALKFNFHTSNNEEEYEAILAGMKLAREMGASRVAAMSDSLLVANQFNGIYDVKEDRMKKILGLRKSNGKQLQRILRKSNTKITK